MSIKELTDEEILDFLMTSEFDDDYSPAHRILFDDTIENKKTCN